MRVPVEWLREHVDVPVGATAADVAETLVRVGLEEEGLHGGGVTGPLVVGRVLAVEDEPQKNGKTIRWCSVDVGDDATDGPAGRGRGIVCGASNFAVGDLVVVVLPGAVLPGGFAISARRTYGHVSDGMICSAAELGLGDDAGGIVVLDRWGVRAEPGDDAVRLLGLDEQTVEVNVTPDRGYALSVRGVAREYAHGARLDVARHLRDPAAAVTAAAPAGPGHPVVLADDAGIHGVPGCDRFVARVVRGVDPAAPTPFPIRRRLVAAGMRPISLAVDVTNYVMLLLGQPLHAYDLAALDGPITVRRARPGERMTTLDGADRALHPEDLLITDGDAGSRAIGLAGVMGGADTEVGPATRDVLVEAAHFDPVTVARTARRHKLPSEASRRFERGVDPLLAPVAAQLVVDLLVAHGGGTADPTGTDAGEPRLPAPVTTRVGEATRLVGVDYPPERVTALLGQVGCAVADGADGAGGAGGGDGGDGRLVVTPPSWRPDLAQPADLVEEVARLAGYAEIPSVVPVAPPGRGLDRVRRARRSVSRTLAEAGLVEVLASPFAAPRRHDELGLAAGDPRRSAVRLANPLSDEEPELRTSLLATLVDVLRRNLARGAADVAVFEVGRVTGGGRRARPAAAPATTGRPSDAELAAVLDAVPAQPWHVAGLLTGQREPAGWWGPGRPADHTDAVEAALAAAQALGVALDVVAAVHPPWHPGRCAALRLPDGTPAGHAGELHPGVVATLALPPRTCAFELDLDVLVAAAPDVVPARPLSTAPLAKEDVALVVPAAVPAEDVRRALVAGGGPLLEDVRLFDVYTGEQVPPGHRSLAFALRLRAPDRTLTTEEASAVRDEAVAEAGRRHGAVLRGA